MAQESHMCQPMLLSGRVQSPESVEQQLKPAQPIGIKKPGAHPAPHWQQSALGHLGCSYVALPSVCDFLPDLLSCNPRKNCPPPSSHHTPLQCHVSPCKCPSLLFLEQWLSETMENIWQAFNFGCHFSRRKKEGRYLKIKMNQLVRSLYYWGIQNPFCWMVLKPKVAEKYIVPLNIYFWGRRGRHKHQIWLQMENSCSLGYNYAIYT